MKKYTLIVFMFICLPFITKAQSTISLDVTSYGAACGNSASGSAKVTVYGGTAPYTYQWSCGSSTTDSISGLAAGLYYVTVTDHNGITATTGIIIRQNEPPTVGIGANIVRPCFLTSGGGVCGCANTLWAIASGGTPPYSYTWTPSGETGDTLHRACYLEFTVTVTDINNCASSDSINVQIPGPGGTTSVAQVNNSSAITIYPNPASTQLNVSIGASITGITNIAIYDISGQQLFQQDVIGNNNNVTIDISRFPIGNYLLRSTNGSTLETTHFSILR